MKEPWKKNKISTGWDKEVSIPGSKSNRALRIGQDGRVDKRYDYLFSQAYQNYY